MSNMDMPTNKLWWASLEQKRGADVSYEPIGRNAFPETAWWLRKEPGAASSLVSYEDTLPYAYGSSKEALAAIMQARAYRKAMGWPIVPRTTDKRIMNEENVVIGPLQDITQERLQRPVQIFQERIPLSSSPARSQHARVNDAEEYATFIDPERTKGELYGDAVPHELFHSTQVPVAQRGTEDNDNYYKHGPGGRTLARTHGLEPLEMEGAGRELKQLMWRKGVKLSPIPAEAQKQVRAFLDGMTTKKEHAGWKSVNIVQLLDTLLALKNIKKSDTGTLQKSLRKMAPAASKSDNGTALPVSPADSLKDILIQVTPGLVRHDIELPSAIPSFNLPSAQQTAVA